MQVQETLKELVMLLITIGGTPLAIIFIFIKSAINYIDRKHNEEFDF